MNSAFYSNSSLQLKEMDFYNYKYNLLFCGYAEYIEIIFYKCSSIIFLIILNFIFLKLFCYFLKIFCFIKSDNFLLNDALFNLKVII